jgi:tetratricopeptide (TPR) repeat protein
MLAGFEPMIASRRNGGYWSLGVSMRSLLLILGALLAVYCGADVLLETRYAGDQQIEEQFCRFLLCDNTRVFRAASKALRQRDAPAPEEGVAGFLLLLQRDPNFPFAWVNLGDALAAAERVDAAEYCFRQAVALAPRWPPILMRAVHFYFQSGNPKAALPLASQVLDQVEKYDSEIFRQYIGQAQGISEALQYGLPQNPRPARAWLSYLTQTGKLPEARETWRWVRAHGFADREGANGYVSFLLAQHRAEEAMGAWKDYLGAREGDYGTSNYAFNGGFENQFSGSPLDWKIQPTEGVEVSRDDTAPDSGQWSLRIRFDGKHNATDTGVKLAVILPRGAYRFRARVRTEGLTTDQGIQLRILSLDPAQSTGWSSSQWLGTNSWSTVEIPFIVPANGRVYGIQLVRNPSLKFDSLIAGTVWIDSVRVELAQN